MVFVSPQGNRSLQGDVSFVVDEDSLFSASTSKKGRSKSGSHSNLDNIAAFGQPSGERCLLQLQEIHEQIRALRERGLLLL